MNLGSVLSVVIVLIVLYFPVLAYTCWSRKKELETVRNELFHIMHREYHISREEAVKAFEDVLKYKGSSFYEVVNDVVSSKLKDDHYFPYYGSGCTRQDNADVCSGK